MTEKREYLFRAKRYSGNDKEPYQDGWEYGDLMKDHWFTYGMTMGADTNLCRETIGMWTGLMDCHRRLIYEGDIIRVERKKDNFVHDAIVKFDRGEFVMEYKAFMNVLNGQQEVIFKKDLSGLLDSLDNILKCVTVTGDIYQQKEIKCNEMF